MTDRVDTLRAVELNEFVTFFDGVLGRLLIAAGQPEGARARLDAALQLAEDTEMRFYNAELLRSSRPHPRGRRCPRRPISMQPRPSRAARVPTFSNCVRRSTKFRANAVICAIRSCRSREPLSVHRRRWAELVMARSRRRVQLAQQSVRGLDDSGMKRYLPKLSICA